MNRVLRPLRLLPLLSQLYGCSTEAPHERPTSVATALAPIESPGSPGSAGTAPKTFGAPIPSGRVLSLADVLTQPERFRNQAITVEGQVRNACTRRGCWMELAAATDPQLPGCRVTFKDYGFFVPTDSAGARAKVQGTLAINTLPAERVRHLESEGGQFARKNSDGSANELSLVATGVELWR